MRSLWLLARHEYVRTVFQRRFLIATLAVPVGLAALIGFVILVAVMGENRLPVGYVDPSGALDVAQQANLTDPEDRIEIRAYPDEASGMAALQSEEIQALFVMPPGYPADLQSDLYYLEEPPAGDAWRDFDDFIRLNLAGALPEEVRGRVLEGPAVTVEDISSGRLFSERRIINVILPIAATFLFVFATMSAAGYMLQIVADEKENRMMEVMLTSVSAGQMITGKAAGLVAATLTQFAIYVLGIVVAILVGAYYLEPLRAAEVSWSYLGLMALFFLPAYALISGLMVAIGSSVTELQQGQQIAGILNLFFLLPVMLLPLFFNDPGGPAAVFFTLFPTTSFLTISLRWGLGTIPGWQLALSWAILSASAGLALWAARRIFRAGMLHYGQPLKMRSVLQALRSSA